MIAHNLEVEARLLGRARVADERPRAGLLGSLTAIALVLIITLG